MSLRIKLILALLLTSLASVGLVGGVAYMELMHKFNDRVLHDAFDHFQANVVAYVHTYGSWEQGLRHESFRAFAIRHRPMGGGPGTSLGVGQAPRNPPPSGRPPIPPFRFLLFDPDGKILLPIPPHYRVGDKVRKKDRQGAHPIRLDGRVIAYASPRGLATLSHADREYLHAMRTALTYGVVSATVLAVLLGILFGNTLSRALRRLTHAFQSMGEGALSQRVDIKSRDEVGLLAKAFNGMSEELARSRDELEHSHRTITQQAAELEELSIRDFLTDLYNRRYFDEQAERLFEQASRYRHALSVMLGDIDLFKSINDRFTHAVGDEVLKRVADILRESTRNTDLVARYGGEEFVIAFPETPLAQAAELCEKLRFRIETHDWASIHPDLKVTMSMGLGSNADAPGMEAMLRAADTLLYEAKKNGRNRVCHP